jgi:hypothetical protein
MRCVNTVLTVIKRKMWEFYELNVNTWKNFYAMETLHWTMQFTKIYIRTTKNPKRCYKQYALQKKKTKA